MQEMIIVSSGKCHLSIFLLQSISLCLRPTLGNILSGLHDLQLQVQMEVPSKLLIKTAPNLKISYARMVSYRRFFDSI
jgi:hypothetical protein